MILHRTLKPLSLAISLGITLSACGGSFSSITALEPALAPPEASVGPRLTKHSGELSLYTFDSDRIDRGDSDCNAGCSESWPSHYADAGVTESGPFT